MGSSRRTSFDRDNPSARDLVLYGVGGVTNLANSERHMPLGGVARQDLLSLAFSIRNIETRLEYLGKGFAGFRLTHANNLHDLRVVLRILSLYGFQRPRSIQVDYPLGRIRCRQSRACNCHDNADDQWTHSASFRLRTLGTCFLDLPKVAFGESRNEPPPKSAERYECPGDSGRPEVPLRLVIREAHEAPPENRERQCFCGTSTLAH